MAAHAQRWKELHATQQTDGFTNTDGFVGKQVQSFVSFHENDIYYDFKAIELQKQDAPKTVL